MQYLFNEYSADIEHTRQGIHNTSAYNCLGLIGELGELIELLLQDVLPDSQDELEEEILYQLNQFLVLASKIELLKKRIRKSQIKALPDVTIPENSQKLREELGGVLWYLDTLATDLKTSLAQAAYENQEMLARRFNHNPDWMTNDGEKLH